jgi:hypothetical protein
MFSKYKSTSPRFDKIDLYQRKFISGLNKEAPDFSEAQAMKQN